MTPRSYAYAKCYSDVTIRVSSSGIAKVGLLIIKMTLVSVLTDRSEFLRGDSTSDECEPLFKQYKICLTVNYHL